MLKLYHYNASVCSQKVRMTLFVKDLIWNEKEIDQTARILGPIVW